MSARGDLGFDTTQAAAVAIGVVAATIVLVITPVIFSMLVGVGPVGTGTGEEVTATDDGVALDGDSFATIVSTGDVLEITGAVDSTGYAIELTGASDSYVESQQPVNFTGDSTFTGCTWAEVDDDAGSKTMTALSMNGRVLIQYNGTAGNWGAWYYDDGSRDSYFVEIAAPDQAGNLTHVCAVANETSFYITRNNSIGEVDDVTASSTESHWTDATNWDGRLEETRTDDDELTSSQRQQLVDSPVAPLTGTNRTARLMYDEGAGSLTTIWVAGVDADLHNAQWVDGFDGHELDRGTDYETTADLDEIRSVGGGQIEGAPVVWLDYRYADYSAFPPMLIPLIQSSVVLGSVLVILVVIGGIISVMVAIAMSDGGGRRGGDFF